MTRKLGIWFQVLKMQSLGHISRLMTLLKSWRDQQCRSAGGASIRKRMDFQRVIILLGCSTFSAFYTSKRVFSRLYRRDRPDTLPTIAFLLYHKRLLRFSQMLDEPCPSSGRRGVHRRLGACLSWIWRTTWRDLRVTTTNDFLNSRCRGRLRRDMSRTSTCGGAFL